MLRGIHRIRGTVPYEAVFDGVYRLEACGVLTASSVSATNTVYKIETDLPVRDIYRTSRVDYQYYPQGDGGLEPGYKYTSTQSALSCVAADSTSSNTNIYTFRYATFTFTANVPAASGGYHNWEFTKTGVTKGSGIRFLAEKLGVAMESTMACGDSQNDLAMLEAVEVAVAMGNAKEEVKQIADFISKTNNESGVAYAIEQLVFGENQ